MGKSFETKGIILSEMPMSESDKRLVVFTPEYGKLTVFAKGCKKATSKLLAVSQLFVYGQFELIEGRTAYSMVGGEVIESFYAMREHMQDTTYGMYFLEFIQGTTEDGHSDIALYELLLRSLYQIKLRRIDIQTVQVLFELKALALLGYPVQVDQCSQCGSESLLEGIHLAKGQIMCAKCFSFKDPHVLRIDEMTRNAIGFVQQVPLSELYKHHLTEELRRHLGAFATQFIAIHIGKKFKTKSFLNTFTALDGTP